MAAVAELQRGDVLLVAKRDRLGRDPLIVGMIEAAVRKLGGRIVSAAGEGTEGDDPASQLLRGIIDVFAMYERLLIIFRTKAAMAAKKRRGERVGQIPYGKDLVEGKLVDNAIEQECLSWISTLALAGNSPARIARLLNQSEVPTKNGRTWKAQTIKRILARETDRETQATPAATGPA